MACMQVVECACAHLQDESPHLDVLVNAWPVSRALAAPKGPTLKTGTPAWTSPASGASTRCASGLLIKRQRRGAVIHVAPMLPTCCARYIGAPTALPRRP
ncbi:hypothetical protein DSL92_07655 [Billgrantia gudaonensis]|uniref:Uncharacterized protein n=1 Tax=Billgrantia gudaonensis TaxID=376427 RepID=A0A3S0NEG4_9GAMM|nr:hypothetical protein DSL92_07655 [Halomonas gudaonensis]